MSVMFVIMGLILLEEYLLVPPLAAIEAWLLFNERLGPIQLIGFALALGGVLLGRSRGKRPPVADPAETVT